MLSADAAAGTAGSVSAVRLGKATHGSGVALPVQNRLPACWRRVVTQSGIPRLLQLRPGWDQQSAMTMICVCLACGRCCPSGQSCGSGCRRARWLPHRSQCRSRSVGRPASLRGAAAVFWLAYSRVLQLIDHFSGGTDCVAARLFHVAFSGLLQSQAVGALTARPRRAPSGSACAMACSRLAGLFARQARPEDLSASITFLCWSGCAASPLLGNDPFAHGHDDLLANCSGSAP